MNRQPLSSPSPHPSQPPPSEVVFFTIASRVFGREAKRPPDITGSTQTKPSEPNRTECPAILCDARTRQEVFFFVTLRCFPIQVSPPFFLAGVKRRSTPVSGKRRCTFLLFVFGPNDGRRHVGVSGVTLCKGWCPFCGALFCFRSPFDSSCLCTFRSHPPSRVSAGRLTTPFHDGEAQEELREASRAEGPKTQQQRRVRLASRFLAHFF